MTMKTLALAAIATVLPTASAFAHGGAHSHMEGSALVTHVVNSAFHAGPAIVALAIAFGLIVLAKKRSNNAR